MSHHTNFFISRYTARMKIYQPIVFALLALAACTAQAQWQWIDNHGKKVFSDRPPPPDIADKAILKRPGGAPVSSASPSVNTSSAGPSTASASTTPPPAAGAALPRPTGKDPELEKKKSQAEAAEAAKRKAEEQRIAAAKADNCERAKRALAPLQSGARVVQMNAQGEREFLSDEGRQAEISRVQGIMESDCKP